MAQDLPETSAANYFYKAIKELGINYKAPGNLSSLWNFGVYSLICLLIQILTGITLAMHYVPHIDFAFASVEHIMRDVNYGWLIRYIHSNGASMFFIVVYLHTFRGIFYSSYAKPRQLLWHVGVTILFLMIATAFMGYVLPWGQMSFWGATVITNLFSAIPIIGQEIVIWLWGGYAIANATLTRFYALHFLFPIIIASLVGIHLYLLHLSGSSNPIGQTLLPSKIFFAPYYIIKDLYGVITFLIFFSFFVFFFPNMLGHSDNYIPANPLVTPAHIVPEWYLLPFYTILRSIPDKLLGVIALALCIAILYFLPPLSIPLVKSMKFKPIPRIIFFCFLAISLVLGWIGGCVVAYPFVQIGQIFAILYFIFFIVILPLLNLNRAINI
jgi:ubiquinol-cytochrome c reductase cytochrome b/c1 subunit